MLNVYTSLSDYITKDKMFIDDVEMFFGSNLLLDDSYTKLVLKSLEKSTVYKGNTFVDKYGINLYTDNLSTGSKILLSIAYYPQYIFNAVELGYNAALLLSYIKDGNLYIANRDFELCDCGTEVAVNIDGQLCTNIDEVNVIIGG